MKKCGSCKRKLAFVYFSKNKNTKTGFNSWCKKCCKASRESRKEKLKKYHTNYYITHVKEIKKYVLKNKEKRSEANKKWYSENREYNNKKVRNRRHNNNFIRMIVNLRSRICSAFKGKEKSKKTSHLLGCSFKEAKKYLESKFKPGMNWKNHGFYGWHIDHVIPLSSAKNISELEKLCHYTNLQPLWAKENLSKGNKI